MLSNDLVFPLTKQYCMTALKLLTSVNHAIDIFCCVCGKFVSVSHNNPPNLRESLQCPECGATNRQRQIAYYICTKFNLHSLSELSDSLRVWNTESSRCFHEVLKDKSGYVCSEYFGGEEAYINGIRNEDIHKTSFPDNHFDLIITADLFEHLQRPYMAHMEVLRILKTSGLHVFTVPFNPAAFHDDVRAIEIGDEIVYLKDPIYHPDPIRDEGCLVYTIFSIEMIPKIYSYGGECNIFHFNHPNLGLLGEDAFVFVVRKNAHWNTDKFSDEQRGIFFTDGSDQSDKNLIKAS